MAKSSRSKIKRANRALKREKNSKKEGAKLVKMLEQTQETVGESEKKVYTVLGSASVKPEEPMMVDGAEPEKEAANTTSADVEDGDEMPMGVGSRQANGNFPVWMNKRAIKKAKSLEKKKSRQKNKAKRTGSRPWRK